MICQGDDTLRELTGLPDAEQKRIMDFLQGSVYCWCKNRPDEWFAMHNLMGGDNRDWSTTPLAVLYSRHIQNGKTDEEAFNTAAQDSGWLLKRVIHADARRFATQDTAINRQYRWLQDS